MFIDPQMAVVLGFLFTLLVALIGWFARTRIERVERELQQEKEERAKAVEKVEAQFTALQLTVAKECINSERLMAALAPLGKQLDTLTANVDRLFEKLDGKQDKARA